VNLRADEIVCVDLVESEGAELAHELRRHAEDAERHVFLE
jgi:hypothetical protein